MEVHQETKLPNSKLGGLSTAHVRRRSTKQLLDIPNKRSAMVFDPYDPYSSAMDNIPLKDLFPNVKVRKRAQERKIESSDTPSPRSQETQESVRNKLRESLAAALRSTGSADFDQSPEPEWKSEGQTGDEYRYTGQEPSHHVLAFEQVKTEEEKLMREVHGEDSEYVLSGGRLDPEWRGRTDGCDLFQHGGDVLMDRTVDSVQMALPEESPYKKLKVEVEENVREEDNGLLTLEQAEKVAVDIETELFRHFGGVNRKYKEKARSLLFNLKDRSNPELRMRVLSGEITPENLCCMNAEQLASRELSQWRMAKAEEFAHMVVLTDADADMRRLVKKTHKGEFEVQVEKDEVLTEVVTGGVRQRSTLGAKQETDEKGADIQADSIIDDEVDNIFVEAEGLEFSPIRDPILCSNISGDQVYDETYEWDQDKEDKGLQGAGVEPVLPEDTERDSLLPAIMSLDEYLGSRKDRELNAANKVEEPEVVMASETLGIKSHAPSHANEIHLSYSLNGSKDRGPRKSVGSPNLKAVESGSTKIGDLFQKERKKEHRKQEKLWEGSFQLSGFQISPVLAFFKSGERVELQSWPKMVEIKGRVRLDALDKFLQELHLSRTRSIMIISCRVKEGQEENGTSVTAMKEAANQYQKGERVGYAEPAPGFELYLFPAGGSSLKLLVEHGYFSMNKIVADEEQEILIGCVVWRRNLISSNVTHKTSSHYFSANRHALSGQLDSPTHPNEVQWAGRASASFKTSSVPLPNASSGMPLNSQFEDQQATMSFAIAQSRVSVANIKGEDMHTAANKNIPSTPQRLAQRSPGSDTNLSRSTQLPHDPRSGRFKAPLDRLQKDSSKEEENSDDIPPGFGPKAVAMVKPGIEPSTAQDDDDDDLPEFDFASQSASLVPLDFAVKPSEVLKGNVSHVPQPSRVQVASSLPQGSLFPQVPQIQQGSIGFSVPTRSGPFEQLNPSVHPSFFPTRPQIPPQMPGALEQVSSSQQLPQLFPQSQSFSQRPLPPPVPPPVQPLITFPQRPHPSGDGPFLARPPGVAPVSVPGALHVEHKNIFSSNFNLRPQGQSIMPRPYGDPPRPLEHFPGALQEQRTRVNIPGVPSHSNSGALTLNTMQPMELRRRSTLQASNLWDDDDDMPEWCPPPLMQQETSLPPLHPMPALPIVEAGQPGLIKETSKSVMPLRPVVPLTMSRGWQGMPPQLLSEMERGPMQQEGRGILQAPPFGDAPPLRYLNPLGGGILPALRAEQLSTERNMSNRDVKSGEVRELKRDREPERIEGHMRERRSSEAGHVDYRRG